MPYSTLGDMRTRIINETVRDDLTDELAVDLDNCIQKSIDHYEWERWWFNEALVTVNCTPGSIYVPIDPTVRRIDAIRCIIGGVRYKMTERQVDWLMAAYSTPVVGQPTEWATLVDQVMVYPNPNLAYPLLMEQIVQVQPPLDFTIPQSSNRWTNEGADLIVARTKMMLYRDYLSATAQDQRLGNAIGQEDEAYTELRSFSNRRMSIDRVLPGW